MSGSSGRSSKTFGRLSADTLIRKDLPRTKISLELCGYCLPNFDWKRLSDFLAIHCRSVFASLGILLLVVFYRFVLRSCAVFGFWL